MGIICEGYKNIALERTEHFRAQNVVIFTKVVVTGFDLVNLG